MPIAQYTCSIVITEYCLINMDKIFMLVNYSEEPRGMFIFSTNFLFPTPAI